MQFLDSYGLSSLKQNSTKFYHVDKFGMANLYKVHEPCLSFNRIFKNVKITVNSPTGTIDPVWFYVWSWRILVLNPTHDWEPTVYMQLHVGMRSYSTAFTFQLISYNKTLEDVKIWKALAKWSSIFVQPCVRKTCFHCLAASLNFAFQWFSMFDLDQTLSPNTLP